MRSNVSPSTPTVPPAPTWPAFGSSTVTPSALLYAVPSMVVLASLISGIGAATVTVHQLPPPPDSLVATAGTKRMVLAPLTALALRMN